jgi:ankyrin repeat protein
MLSTDADKALWLAILGKDAKGVARAAQQGADLNGRVPQLGVSVALQMQHALTKERDSLVDERTQATLTEHVLSTLQRDPRSHDHFTESTWSPLLVACHYGLAEVRAALLAAGANPGEADETGLTPLLIAVRKGDSEGTRSLLEAGADPNHSQPRGERGVGVQGHSPLVRAAGDGNLALVELLLAHGAELDRPNSAGQTALLAACGRPHGALVWSELSEREDREETSDDLVATMTAMTERLGKPLELPEPEERVGDWDAIVTLLLERGADIETEVEGEYPIVGFGLTATPLIQAAGRGDLPLVERLLTAGATPRASGGTSPLHAALQGAASIAVLQRLLEAGADPNVRDSELMPVIGVAARSGNLEALKLLQAFGVDIHQRGEKSGGTLLHVAADTGKTEVIAYLLDQGLERDAPMIRPSRTEQAQKLRDSFKELTQGPQSSVLQEALAALPETPEPPIEGVTPLMIAAARHQTEAVALLLERGADPQRYDSDGKTARDYALSSAQQFQSKQGKVQELVQRDVKQDLGDTLAKLPEATKAGLDEQMQKFQATFTGMFDQMFTKKHQAAEATLALLPEN